MPRRTKIVATIGPASEDPATLVRLVDAGMDVARIGLAHGTLDEHLARVARVRAAAAEAGRHVGILADLPGPKLRAAPFPEGGVFVAEGDTLTIAQSNGAGGSTAHRIEVDDPGLVAGIRPGDAVVLGDGAVEVLVEEVKGGVGLATVVSGGRLQGRPGVTAMPDRLEVESPTPDDLRLLAGVCAAGVDMVAISFVCSPEDVLEVRAAAGKVGPLLVPKIETAAAVDHLDGIIACADGVMVARGDLGMRVPLEDVPHIQKRIIRSCVEYGRPVITATQMLESMVNSPTPTRAEVSDVANSVFDGTDAVMLSAETAIGHDPVLAVRTMARIAERAEAHADYPAWGGRLGKLQGAMAAMTPIGLRVTGAITAAAWRAALEVGAAAIICCTRSGATARAIARFRPTAPLFAVTPTDAVARQLALTWGVTPFAGGEHGTTDEIVWFAVEQAVRAGLTAPGDVVVVLAGSPDDPEPVTDVLRIIRVH